MPLPASRTPCEPDTRGCPVCGKPVEVSGMGGYCFMIDATTGEFRFGHSLCGINHHTETKRKLAEAFCVTCQRPFKDNHTLESGKVPRCGNGAGEYVRGEPVSPSREVEAA